MGSLRLTKNHEMRRTSVISRVFPHRPGWYRGAAASRAIAVQPMTTAPMAANMCRQTGEGTPAGELKHQTVTARSSGRSEQKHEQPAEEGQRTPSRKAT